MIGDDLYGWCSTQNGMGIRSGLASATGLPLHKVHARVHVCGGGHGDGGSETYLQMAARCSMKLSGHAILVRLSRDNHNTLGSRHYNTKATFKVGAKKDGTLVAWSGDWYGVGGGASGCWYGLRTTFNIAPPSAGRPITFTATCPGAAPGAASPIRPELWNTTPRWTSWRRSST